jgi:excisionase family DNA binding protein
VHWPEGASIHATLAAVHHDAVLGKLWREVRANVVQEPLALHFAVSRRLDFALWSGEHAGELALGFSPGAVWICGIISRKLQNRVAANCEMWACVRDDRNCLRLGALGRCCELLCLMRRHSRCSSSCRFGISLSVPYHTFLLYNAILLVVYESLTNSEKMREDDILRNTCTTTAESERAMPQYSEQERLLTVEEIAEQVSVTHETVRRWLRSGDLRGVRLARKAGWRVREGDLQRFLERHIPESGANHE